MRLKELARSQLSGWRVVAEEMETVKPTTLQALVRDATESGLLAVEAAKLDFALSLRAAMERAGIHRAELARRLGVRPPLVTRLLRGDANPTIETLARAAHAVGAEVRVLVESDPAQTVGSEASRQALGRAAPAGPCHRTAAARAKPSPA